MLSIRRSRYIILEYTTNVYRLQRTCITFFPLLLSTIIFISEAR